MPKKPSSLRFVPVFEFFSFYLDCQLHSTLIKPDESKQADPFHAFLASFDSYPHRSWALPWITLIPSLNCNCQQGFSWHHPFAQHPFNFPQRRNIQLERHYIESKRRVHHCLYGYKEQQKLDEMEVCSSAKSTDFQLLYINWQGWNIHPIHVPRKCSQNRISFASHCCCSHQQSKAILPASIPLVLVLPLCLTERQWPVCVMGLSKISYYECHFHSIRRNIKNLHCFKYPDWVSSALCRFQKLQNRAR